MQQLRGTPVQKQPQCKSYISKDMGNTMHVFVRHYAIHKPLQPPYDSPYCVLKRAGKHYMLDIAGHPEVVSLDHLKPAYLESNVVTGVHTPTQATSTAPPTELPVTITRSCRRVCKPVHFS